MIKDNTGKGLADELILNYGLDINYQLTEETVWFCLLKYN